MGILIQNTSDLRKDAKIREQAETQTNFNSWI